ncbi:hypothetical protein GOP47_0012918 [Adiantum capillus-veneris]|uniref:Uncharacterized protein n=1 Tax=Adiantum capillus-veneris TaxID=13818 RepID=A0A9D4US41_ADICA|nr:hypothetical protein GOP47_0012918 [Adiantum capillus-veneris]
MGNHFSCMSPSASINRLQYAAESQCISAINLLHWETGALSQLRGRLTAAEAMMEFPAQFLCPFSSAPSASPNCGRRICAVPADEELQAAELYLLLPMDRLNTRFSTEELAGFAELEAAWKCHGKQGGANIFSQSKVAPFPASPASDAYMQLGSMAESSVIKLRGRPFYKLRLEGAAAGRRQVMCRSKSWMPKLETVNEHAAGS